MNNLVTNFHQILEFAKSYGLPISKKRAIIREYLQSKILEILYQQPLSRQIFFVGGTALRLLFGLDRFSEDLDFDVDSRTPLNACEAIIYKLHRRLLAENIECQLYVNHKITRTYYELRFPQLLHQLKLSSSQNEKLMIKLDFENSWQHQQSTTVLFQRYGFMAQVVSLPLDIFLVQKMQAYLTRAETQPRDLYDIIWLINHHSKPDTQFMQHNKISSQLISQCIQKFAAEKSRIANYQKRLQIYLLNEVNSKKISCFDQVVQGLGPK